MTLFLTRFGRAEGGAAHRHHVEDMLDLALGRAVAGIGAHALEHSGDRADVRRDRHRVVVQHDDQRRLELSRVVDRLIRKAARQRAVAEDRDHRVVLPPQVARHCHADRGRHRRTGVAGAKLIVLAFLAHQEAGNAAFLPDRMHQRSAARQHLVWIGLVACIPHDLVAWAVKDAVERHRELNGAEIRRKMSAGLFDGGDELFAELARDLGELSRVEVVEVAWIVHRIKKARHVPP